MGLNMRQVKMYRDKTTKSTHRYVAEGSESDPAVKMVYVVKSSLPGDPPDQIILDITFETKDTILDENSD